MSAPPVAAPWRRTLVLQGHHGRQAGTAARKKRLSQLHAHPSLLMPLTSSAWHKNGTHNKWETKKSLGRVSFDVDQSPCRRILLRVYLVLVFRNVGAKLEQINFVFYWMRHPLLVLLLASLLGVLWRIVFQRISCCRCYSDPAAPTLTRELSTGQVFRSNSDTFVYTWCLFLTWYVWMWLVCSNIWLFLYRTEFTLICQCILAQQLINFTCFLWKGDSIQA